MPNKAWKGCCEQLRRGAFNGIVDLHAAIKRLLKKHNADPKPSVWTKPAAEIFDKLARLSAPSDSVR